MINKFTVPMSATEFRTSVTGISELCTKFKIDVFRSSAANGSVDDYKVRTFLGSVNSFVRTWESYGKELQKAIQNSDPENINAYSVEYDLIKPFIFATYDYASVLQFTDGVVRGAKNTDITKDSKYADFFAMTLRRAFKDRPADAGMMVNEVLTFNIQKADNKEKSLFKSIKNKNMFDNNDRIEIYKSIEKSVEYLTDVILNPSTKEYTYFNGQMRASACNWIIEYVKATMLAFSCRTYAISQYARDYVKPRYGEGPDTAKITESADTTALSEITFMKDVDDSIVFDPFNYDTYIEKVTEWLTSFTTVGNVPDLKKIRDRYMSDEDFTKLAGENKVYAKLSLNSLVNFIFDSNLSESIPRSIYDDNVSNATPEKVIRNLKDFITSKNLGTGESTSPLLELIEVIKNITPANDKGERDDTVAGYEQLACDLISTYTIFAYRITEIYRRLSNNLGVVDQPNTLTNKYLNDMRFILCEMYKTTGVAVLSKCRDIEMKINDLRRANFKSALEEISIKIPGGLKSDYDSNINTMSAVADTNRSFVEAADAISMMSELDRLNMYDEYVKTIPGMENDWYYSEAFSFQDLINKILALLQGIKKKWDEFFTNAQFKAAVAWCEKNKDTLAAATFNGNINSFDYKYNGGTHLDKLITAINNCDLGKATKEGGLEEYRKTLYEGIDANLYSSTYGSNPAKDWNPKAFQNWVLFGNASAGDIPASDKVVNKDLVGKWVNDVSKSMTTYEGCKKVNDDLTAAMQSLKNKVVALKPEQTEQPPAVGGEQTEEEKKKAEEAQKKSEQENAVYTAAQQVLNVTQQAINDLYNPMIPIVTGMLRTEYKYIQQAWGMRVNGQQSQPNPTT